MKKFPKRLLAVVLAVAMLVAYAVPALASDERSLRFEKADKVIGGLSKNTHEQEVSTYKDTDPVRVAVVLSQPSTLAAGYPTRGIANNTAAMRYRADLKKTQEAMTKTISEALGKEPVVRKNVTLAANMISMEVLYGDIETIKSIPGVKSVAIELEHYPDVVSRGPAAETNQIVATGMTGADFAQYFGLTGAGSRVAIIDTGLDLYHQAVDPNAFLNAIYEDEQMSGIKVDLLDAAEIAAVLPELSISGVNAEDLYRNAKVPFAYNYIDGDLDVSHMNDGQGEHGSHVAGIAAANRYVLQGDAYVDAVEATKVVGTAPDAQLMIMKVFGKSGGPTETDYMGAIEDAILLGADAVNMSLGSTPAGYTTSEEFQAVWDFLSQTDTVVVCSGGNSGAWADMTLADGTGAMYADDVNFHTGGSSGSYGQAFAVGSVDNMGQVTTYLQVGENKMGFAESVGEYSNAPLTTLDPEGTGKEYEYVMLDGYGCKYDDNDNLVEDQFEGMDLTGKIAICSRGTSSFFQKANVAASHGAAAVIIYNNAPGVIYLNLTGYTYNVPVVSIQQADAQYLRDNAETAENGVYTGRLSVHATPEVVMSDAAYPTMSSFSSFGVPGSLIMKPEITAPGGNIYSIFGSSLDGNGNPQGGTDQYELMSGTSMAAPQVTGMMAAMMQYIREYDLHQDGMTDRALAQSLLMSTAEPIICDDGDGAYIASILQQGSGLANIMNAMIAESYITMNSDATDFAADGKVKVELGDDPGRTGTYSFSFNVNSLSDYDVDYTVDALTFIQNLASDGYDLYTMKDTVTVASTLKVTVDGKTLESIYDILDYDFNDDGVFNKADAQLLMEHVVNNAELLAHQENSDVDGDKDVDTHDVYALLGILGKTKFTVPAGGSVTVEVTLALTEDTKALINDYYVNGTYVEGFIEVAPAADAEGAIYGSSHTIPVLGFFGDWSDASMFDRCSILNAYYLFDVDKNTINNEFKLPYLLDYHGGETNFYESAQEIVVGDNPFVYDDAFIADRGALNSTNDAISKLHFTPIRQIAASRIQIFNAETGESYLDEEVGDVMAAFYNDNSQAWANVQLSLNLGWNLTDQEGNPLPDGTKVNMVFTAVPEYYVHDGKVDWQSVGTKGTTLSSSFTVDNTAPTVDDISASLTSDKLTVTATDNRYIAAIAVYDEKTEEVLDYVAPNMTEIGTTSAAFDMSGVDATVLQVEVYDYAGNITAYRVPYNMKYTDTVEDVTLSSSTADLLVGGTYKLSAQVDPYSLSDRTVTWSSDNEAVATVDENGLVTGVGEGTCVITAAATLDPNVTATCAVTVSTLEYTAFGILQDEGGTPLSFMWDFADPNGWQPMAKMPSELVSVDFSLKDNSSFYMMDPQGIPYEVDPFTGEVLNQGQSAGLSYWDICTSPVANILGLDKVTGINGGWLFPWQDPMAPTPMGYNLEQALATYTGASNFTAITFAGLTNDSDYDRYVELYYALDDAGAIWLLGYYPAELAPEGEGAMMMLWNFYPTDLNLKYPGVSQHDASFTSMSVADDGTLFLAHFDGTTSNIYALTQNATGAFTSKYAGNLGDGVWPAGLALVGSNAAGGSVDADAIEELPTVSIPKGDLGNQELTLEKAELAPVKARKVEAPAAPAEEAEEAKAPVIVERPHSIGELIRPDPELNDLIYMVGVTAKDAEGVEVASHNGLFDVTWDPAKLQLILDLSDAEIYAVNEAEGKLTLGYADSMGYASEDVIAALAFLVLDNSEIGANVSYREIDDKDITGGTNEPVVHEHTVSQWTTVKEPTCTETGTKTGLCDECGLEVTEEIPALGHSFGEWTETKAPTCSAEGEEIRTCNLCGHKETRSIPKNPDAHTWGEWAETKAPTCSAEGEVARTCNLCGHKETGSIPVDPDAHAWGEWAETKAPTCSAEGEETRTCGLCNHQETRSIPVDPDAHDWSDYTVTKEPTCTEKGEKTSTCSLCHKTETQEIPALGHSFGEWTVTKAATCTEKGEETRTCAACGEKETREIPTVEHSYKDTVVAPTATEKGYTEHVCTACGHSYKDTYTDPNPNLAPQTGDSFSMLWVLVLAMSTVGMGVMVIARKKFL